MNLTEAQLESNILIQKNRLKHIYENLTTMEDIAEKVSKRLINAEEGYNDSLIALSRISAMCTTTKKYWLPVLYKKELKELNDK